MKRSPAFKSSPAVSVSIPCSIGRHRTIHAHCGEHHPPWRRNWPRRSSTLPGSSCLGADILQNITISGGPAPVRSYIQELLPDVLEGRIQPGWVFDRVIGLGETPDGYRAMDERKAIKVMVKP